MLDAERFIEAQSDPDARRAGIVAFQVAFSTTAHCPLLTKIESFLISLIMQFQVNVYGTKGAAFWREWTSQMSVARHRIASALRKRNKIQLAKNIDKYLAAQRRQFTGHPELISARLSAAWADMTQQIVLGSFDIQPFTNQKK